MTTTSARRDQIVSSLRDKEYRDLFVEEEIDTGLSFQIRALRQSRGWSQEELAERVNMAQETVSRLENLSYGKYTLSTLKRLASAYDVALVVRFAPFSQLVDWVANLSPEDLAVPDFEHDRGLLLAPSKAETRHTAGATPPTMRRYAFTRRTANIRRDDTPASPYLEARTSAYGLQSESFRPTTNTSRWSS